MVNYIRDGKLVWPTCPECGCRLDMYAMEEWTDCMHFGPNNMVDARGCFCSLVNEHLWIETNKVTHIIGV